MAGPGGQEVGRISIKVVPDTSKFRDDLRRTLKNINDKITLPVEVDSDAVRAATKKAAKDASGKEKVTLEAEVDDSNVTRETRRVRRIAQSAVGAIKMTIGVNIPASIARIKADMKIIEKGFKGYNIRIPVDLVGWTKVLAILGLISAAALGAQHAIGAIGGALSVAGGLLATLPAAATAAAAGIGTLVVGFQGLGAALSAASGTPELTKAMKNLAPSAREAAWALRSWKEPLGEIRRAVQQKLFEQVADDIQRLKRLLPGIEDMLTGTAGGIRRMFEAWARMATTTQSINDLSTIGNNVTRMWNAMRTVLADVGAAFRDIAVVGSTFLPDLGRAATTLADQFRTFISDARRTGELRAWIQNSIDAMKQLGRIIGNVWDTFANIRDAMTTGEGFLDMIERLTQGMEDFTGSKQGQEFFQNLAAVMREVLDVATRVFKALANAVNSFLGPAMPFLREFARVLGDFLVGALQALEGPMSSFGRWLSDNKALLAPLVVGILSLVTAFKALVTVSNGIRKLTDSLKAIKTAGGLVKSGFSTLTTAIGTFSTKFGRVAGKMVDSAALWSSRWAKSASFTIRYYTLMAAHAVKKVAVIVSATVAGAARAAGAWIASLARMAAATALRWGMIIASWIPVMTAAVAKFVTRIGIATAAWVANWVRMAAVAMANAARMAVAWLIAMGPVAIVIAIIVGLVAVIILNWNKIRNWTVNTFNNVWNFIKGVFNNVKNWITRKFNEAVRFIGGLPGRIGNALASLWDYITRPFRKAWNWIVRKYEGLVRFFGNINDKVVGALRGLGEGIVAPFKWAWDWIQKIVSWIGNAIEGIKNAAGAVVDFVGGLFSDQVSLNFATPEGFRVPVTFGTDSFDDFGTPSIGFQPYAGGEPAATGLNGTIGKLGRSSRNFHNVVHDIDRSLDNTLVDRMAHAVADGMQGVSIELDGEKVSRKVALNNTKRSRRR